MQGGRSFKLLLFLTAQMKIVGIYVEMREVVIVQQDDGQLVVKAMYTDEGTEQEREVIKQKIMTTGFVPTDTKEFNIEEKK